MKIFIFLTILLQILTIDTEQSRSLHNDERMNSIVDTLLSNMTLIEQSARIAAIEASADDLNWVFSPMIDIARDPRWGSLVAAAMVRGHQ
jgi:hypothetical protein